MLASSASAASRAAPLAAAIAVCLLFYGTNASQCGFTETECNGVCCKLNDQCINGFCCPMMSKCGSTCCADGDLCSNAAAGECRSTDGRIVPGRAATPLATQVSAPSATCSMMQTPCKDQCCGLTDSCDEAHGLCCPLGNAQCNGTCCPTGQKCSDPSNRLCCDITATACGTSCCSIGSVCHEGQCCGAVCGNSCCPEGSYCQNAALGQCAPVPEGHFPCQKTYCKFGGTCVFTTKCVNDVCQNLNFCCDRAYCGEECCPADRPVCGADGKCSAAA